VSMRIFEVVKGRERIPSVEASHGIEEGPFHKRG
jgi:hypothetical protein